MRAGTKKLIFARVKRELAAAFLQNFRFAPIGRAQAFVLPAAALAAAAHLDVVEVAPNALMVVHAAGHVAADGLFLFHCKNLLGYFAHSLPRRRTDYAFLHRN